MWWYSIESGSRPVVYQRLVIFFPVADVVFGLAHLLCPVIVPGEQTTWLGSSLICARPAPATRLARARPVVET